jgi:hypothetical protein
MPRPKLKPGPGRPRLLHPRVKVSLKLQPEVWGLWRTLADVAFGGNMTRAIEHAIRISAVGLEPAEPPLRERGT